jgi:hypothetical protein
MITPCRLIRARVGHMVKNNISDMAKLTMKYCVAEVNLEPHSITAITHRLAKMPMIDINDQRMVINNKNFGFIIAIGSLE